MAQYKYGDEVVANGYKAKVISVYMAHSGLYICTVRFINGSEGDYREKDLKLWTPPNGSIKPQPSYKPTNKVLTGARAKVYVDGVEIKSSPMNYSVGYSISFNKFDNDKTCPLCGDAWHWIPSPFRGMKEIWYDCTKCQLSRKDIKKQLESKDDEF